MDRVYVVEQALTCASEKFQLKFAVDAARLLQGLRGVLAEPTGKGLLILGSAEAPLDVAVMILRAAFGERLRTSERRICFMRLPPMEPVMDVFVRAPETDAPAIRRALEARRATLRFTAAENRGWLLRAEAPMAELLGFADELERVSGGRADHWITFNRWQPLEDSPGGGRAA
jgi:predicted membrane GTPase involved in stress response